MCGGQFVPDARFPLASGYYALPTFPAIHPVPSFRAMKGHFID